MTAENVRTDNNINNIFQIMNFESVEFFSLVADKVGRGEVNEYGRRMGEWKGYVGERLEWVAHYCKNGVMEGEAKIFDVSTGESFEGQIVNACMTGMWTSWNKKRIGRVDYIQFYLNDKKHGFYQRFYPRGNLLELTGSYKNGVRVGEWCVYDASGVLNENAKYCNDGLIQNRNEWSAYFME